MESILSFQSEKKVEQNFDPSVKARALFKVVFGICKEWDLSREELSVLVNRHTTTISDWKKKESISISKNLDMNNYQILEFIELYKALTNFFVLLKDRVSWLRDPNVGPENKSPLALIKEDPRNLHSIRQLVSHLVNP